MTYFEGFVLERARSFSLCHYALACGSGVQRGQSLFGPFCVGGCL